MKWIKTLLLKMLCGQFVLQKIDGSKNIADKLMAQVQVYANGYPPFHVPLSDEQLVVEWWWPLLGVDATSLLVTFAIQLLSGHLTSMPDEHTASTLSWLNSPCQNWMKATMLVANNQIWEFYQCELQLEKIPKPKCVHVDFSTINHDVMEHMLKAHDLKVLSALASTTWPSHNDNTPGLSQPATEENEYPGDLDYESITEEMAASL
ncbi:hypothetical protein FRB94_000656 [Tulasnella sp. JGI-2019a]|nr:hypothetical protein FRB94_000656 [Tulasnella sp. JGI-2019a]